MKYRCWGLQTANGLVKDFRDPLEGFKTLTFRTRTAALEWAQRNDYYRAKPVKLTLLIHIKDF